MPRSIHKHFDMKEGPSNALPCRRDEEMNADEYHSANEEEEQLGGDEEPSIMEFEIENADGNDLEGDDEDSEGDDEDSERDDEDSEGDDEDSEGDDEDSEGDVVDSEGNDDDFEAEDYDEDNRNGSYEGLRKMIRNCSTKALLFLCSISLSHSSERDFKRFLSSLEDDIVSEVLKIWKLSKQRYDIMYLCNKCGKKIDFNQQCCGAKAKFVRMSIFSQLSDLVAHNLDSILSIRKQIKAGKLNSHNLNSPFFRTLWESETSKHLKLSGLLSTDGVKVSGNRKKIWPISFLCLDLPTVDMQRSSNVLLHGVVECMENPSTALWNSVFHSLIQDVEGQIGNVGKWSFSFHLSSVCSDQPAKRSLFGMKAHNSSLSCFFCLAPGTFYKQRGSLRSEVRADEKTRDDSNQCKNGFGPVPALILSRVLPYHTPIDILHNAGEGICDTIIKEMRPSGPNNTKKSDLFDVEADLLKRAIKGCVLPAHYKGIENCRNGSDRIHHFRIQLCLASLSSQFLVPKARMVIVAISLLLNKMYSNAESSAVFDENLCSAIRWFLLEANTKYMNCKVHEILFHLPQVQQLFGNVGPLSTFSYESSYQFTLMGFSSRLTRSFAETCCSRLLLSSYLRRELARRHRESPSDRLETFVSQTNDVVISEPHWKIIIRTPKPVDILLNEGTLYAYLKLPHVCLKSEYADENTVDDVFFMRNENGKFECLRFVCVNVFNKLPRIIAEPVIEIDDVKCFPSLFRAVREMSGTDLYYGTTILDELRTFEGIKYGVLSSKRKVVPLDSIIGSVAYTACQNGIIFLLTNGGCIHN